MSAVPADSYSRDAVIQESWLIGSATSCNLRVDDNSVSGQHCRLTRYAHGFEIEDLASANGTFIDGVRLAPRQPHPVSPTQRVTLGRVPLPWPGQQPRVIRIGRAPDADVVLDFPMISWEHARIVPVNGQWAIEDLGSSNGTALNHIQNRITRAPLRTTDDVYFGSLKIPAARLLDGQAGLGQTAQEQVAFARNEMVIGRDPDCDLPVIHPRVSWHHARLSRTAEGTFVEDLKSLNGTFVARRRISGRVQIMPGQEISLGSVHFQLLDNGTLERRDDRGNVSIQAVDVTVHAPDGSRLLEPISLTVYPSELVALMGPAGAGKTTFLKALNGYTPPAHGRVLYNGADLYQSYDLFRQQLGYVPQDDIVHSQLTVREALYFSARLRTDLSDEEIDERIDRILEALGILDKKNSIIGSPERKVLSGGQRKRVNIALELISDTPVLFLDEPTSGLSSYDAAGVVDLLKRLSQEGKTIIATIHQPSLDAYRKFDNLIMVSRDAGSSGALAFYGPAFPDAIEFFRTPDPLKLTSDGSTTQADLTPETLLTGLASRRTTEWQARYAESHYHQQFVRARAEQVTDEGQAQATVTRGLAFTQWATLVRRNLLVKSRDRAQALILLLQAPLFALLIVLIFGRVESTPALGPHGTPPNPAAMQAFAEMAGEIVGIEFLMVVAAIWFGCNNAARDIVGEWTIFQRERMVSVRLPSYVFSKFALMCGLCLFQCLVLLTVVHVFCGLQGSYVETATVLVLSSLVGAALGLAISSRSASTESAIALLPVVLLPIIALGGGIRAPHKMPEPARSLSYAVPSRWAFESATIAEGRARPCGYFPGDRVWDACPGGGVDAANAQVPDAVSTVNGESRPAPRTSGPSRRFTFAQTLAALGGMLVALLAAVLAFLKMRDIH